MNNVIIKTSQEHVLRRIESYTDINTRDCLDLCVTRVAILPSVLSRFINLIPNNIFVNTSTVPFVYQAIIDTLKKFSPDRLLKLPNHKLLLELTKKISERLVKTLNFNIIFENTSQKWSLKNAIYQDVFPNYVAFDYGYEVSYFDIDSDDIKQQSLDLTKKILTEDLYLRCLTKDFSAPKKRKKTVINNKSKEIDFIFAQGTC